MQYSLGPLCNRFPPGESKCLPSRLGGLRSEEGVNTLQTDSRAATINQYLAMLANVIGNIAILGRHPLRLAKKVAPEGDQHVRDSTDRDEHRRQLLLLGPTASSVPAP